MSKKSEVTKPKPLGKKLRKETLSERDYIALEWCPNSDSGLRGI